MAMVAITVVLPGQALLNALVKTDRDAAIQVQP